MLRRKFNRFAAYDLDDQLQDLAGFVFDTVHYRKEMYTTFDEIFQAYRDFGNKMYAEKEDFYYFRVAVDKFLRMKKGLEFEDKSLDDLEKDFSKVMPLIEKFFNIQRELEATFNKLSAWNGELNRTFSKYNAEKAGDLLLAEVKKIRS